MPGLVPVRETAPRLLTFAMKPFRRRQLELVRVAAAMSGKEAAMRKARAWAVGLDLGQRSLLRPGGGTTGLLVLYPHLSLPL